MEIKVNKKNLRDQIYEIIRGMILRREIEPGEKIIEKELASKIGVSRTPLREALCRLENEKIIKSIPQRGAFVQKQSKETIIEVLLIREVLEGLVARQASQNIDEKALKKLRVCLDKIHNTPDKDKYLIKYTHADEEFHSLLLKVCKNNMLNSMMEMVNTYLKIIRLRTVVIPGRAKKTISEHYEILKAIESKDEQAAENLMRKHIVSVRNYAIKNIEKMV
jgi:DNA-binding GntR family transcriptional regulator